MLEWKSFSRVGQAMGFYACPWGLAVTSLLMATALLSSEPILSMLTLVVLRGIAPKQRCPCHCRVEVYSSSAIPFFAGMASYPSGTTITPKRHRFTLCRVMLYLSDAIPTSTGWHRTRALLLSYPSDTIPLFVGRCRT